MNVPRLCDRAALWGASPLAWPSTVLWCSLLLGASAIAGQRTRDLQLDFAWHQDYTDDDMLGAASTVVVGEVQSLAAIGRPRWGRDDRGREGRWQLVQVNASVESSLKGGGLGKTVEFYYYTLLGPVMSDWNSLRPGGRYVFFLASQGAVLRAVRDHWRSSLEVGTGRHSALARHHRDELLREQIAVLLLEPGEDVEAKRYRRLLPRGIAVAEGWIGRCRTISVLQSASRHASRDVAEAARSQLRLLFSGEACP